MDCSACLRAICEEEGGFITCKSAKCKKAYHVLCTNADNITTDQKENWTCQDCRAKARKGGDNTHTPVRSNENVTLRKKNSNSEQTNSPISHLSSTAEANLQSLAIEMRLMRDTMVKMQTEINERLDSLSNKLSDFDARLKSLEEFKDENMTLKAEILSLHEQLNKNSQSSLSNELEIIGLMETKGENPIHLIMTTAQKIGVSLTEQDIDHVTRTGGHPKGNSYDHGVLKQQTRPLVVRFTRKVKRDEFLKQARVRRDLDSNQIVEKSPQIKVYVNERLTATNRRLFRDARIYASELGYKYCWVRNGSIYIRKREGYEGSPPIHIASEKNLKELVERQQHRKEK